MIKNNNATDDGRFLSLEDYREVSAEDWARYRIEMSRRTIAKLLAQVELGTEYGSRLADILVNSLNEIEALAEDAHAEG